MNERCTICDYFPQHGIRAREFYHVEGEAICQECFSSIAETLKEFEEPDNKEESIERYNLFERKLPDTSESDRNFPAEKITEQLQKSEERETSLENTR